MGKGRAILAFMEVMGKFFKDGTDVDVGDAEITFIDADTIQIRTGKKPVILRKAKPSGALNVSNIESKNSPKAVRAMHRFPNESICQKCGNVNPVWFAPNKLWNEFAGEYHFLCPNCFIGFVGNVVSVWKISPEEAQ